MKNQPHILVYHIGSIGDTIVALPAFRTLRHHFPDGKISLLNLSVCDNTCHANLYEHTDIFDKKTFLRPPKNVVQKVLLYFRFLATCLSGRYSALYCFSPDVPKSLSLFFRIFQNATIRHCFLLPNMPSMPLYQAYLDCLKRENIETSSDAFEFTPTPMEKAAADRLRAKIATEKDTALIAFGIGGGQQACSWPLERYSELISNLKEQISFTPIYLGGEVERDKVPPLIARHGGVFLGDTDCKSLRKTIAFLRHCRCYIGNDTGAAHLAAAAEIPCAEIYSAHDLPPEKWHPFGKHNLYFRSNPDCAGCECRTCPKGDPAPCLDDIASKKILTQILNTIHPKGEK